MKMKQREILSRISLDFARDNETQEEYINRKIAEIKAATKDYLSLTGMKGFVLGLSGGIDSFVCAALAADAIKEINGALHLLLLPCGEQADIADSRECADALTAQFENITCETLSIEPVLQSIEGVLQSSMLKENFDLYSRGNTQARIRMILQYALAKNLLVLGTDHATENIAGYFTKYGDGGTDFNPMEGLIKPDIYEIARRYGPPVCVLTKAPAAGLGISVNDESELKMTYAELAAYLKGNLIDKEKMQRVVWLYDRSEHKRHLPASPMSCWWKKSAESTTHLVVDMTGAFIGGSMACENADMAVKNAVDYINENPDMRVLYVRDCHPEDHCSFEENGGSWPKHAVKGTEECRVDGRFYGVKKTINTPIERYNVFSKGTDSQKEEYSGFDAVNDCYGQLKFNLTSSVVVSGIATEYCVKNTAEDLIKSGFKVSILKRALGYINKEDHKKVLKDLEEMGATLI